MKKNLLLLAFAFSFFSFSQNNSQIDSLETVVKTSNNDSIIMETYNKLRRDTYYSDSKKSQQYSFKYLEYATKRNDSPKVAIANYFIGNSYIVQSNYENALSYYFKASNYFESIKDSLRLSSVLNGIGAAYENNGNDSLSLKYFKQSQHISKSRGDLRRSGIALNNIGNIYKNRGDLITAKTYMENAVSDIKTTNNLQYIIPLSINLANTYTDLKDFNQSSQLFNELLPKIDTIKDIYSHAAILRGLGNSHLAKGNKKLALDYLKQAYYKYKVSDFFDERYDMMPDLIKAFESNKNYASGLKLYNQYNIIKDSIFNNEKDKNLTEAIQEYETLKKDKEIATQQIQIKEKENKFRLAIYAVSLLLIISLGIWLFYRQRQKLKDKEIETLKTRKELDKLEAIIDGEEKERKRIAQDLHDGINGDLSVIKYKFSSISQDRFISEEKEEFNKAIDMLDNSIEQVRHISHNLAPPTLQNFNLIEAIQQYCKKIASTNSLSIDFQNYGELNKLNKETETAIYRIVQEAINNIIKHSKATEALVQINSHQDNMAITIEDNGIGFNPKNNKAGLGLKNIQSRAEFLKSEFSIDSNKNGTTIQIDINLKQLADD
ncbi:tetratricopeptide repeat-containing sensor histidine kinase [Psychroserpens sp.]